MLYIALSNNNKLFIFSLFNSFIMYYQLFITKRSTGKLAQFSCDDMIELNEYVEARKPKFLKIEYHNCSGLVGTAYHYYNFLKDSYITYKKIKA